MKNIFYYLFYEWKRYKRFKNILMENILNLMDKLWYNIELADLSKLFSFGAPISRQRENNLIFLVHPQPLYES